jgi:hypothetical protein
VYTRKRPEQYPPDGSGSAFTPSLQCSGYLGSCGGDLILAFFNAFLLD